MDTKTITGQNSLYIDDAKRCNAVEYNVDGVCVQDGTPTPDNPVEVKTIPSIINLFDKDNANVINCSMSSSAIANSSSSRMIYIPITGGKTYTISKIKSARFRVATTETIPASGVTISNYSSSDSSTSIAITANSSAKYICAYIYLSTADTLTPEEIINTIMIEEGSVAHEYVPYGYWSKVKVTGKNIFNGLFEQGGINFGSNGANSSSTIRIRTDFIEVQPNTTYTISNNNTNINNVGIGLYKEDKTYDSSHKINNGGWNDFPKSFTTQSDTKYVRFTFRKSDDSTITPDGDYEIQIEEGQATAYEPYKENQVLIDMSKTNLFDKTTATIGKYLKNDNSTVNAPNWTISDYIPIQPSTNYIINDTLSNLGDTPARCYYDSNKNYISGIKHENKTPFVDTSPNNAYYMRESMRTDDIDNVVIYESNNPTPYYELSKIGDYKDTLSIDSSGNVVVNKNVGKVVLNGSETTWQTMGWTAPKYGYRVDIPGIKQTTAGGNTPRLFCNYYTPHTQDTVFSTYNYSICQRSNQSQVIIRNDDQTSTSNLKTWLSTYNTDVYYVLATPEIINLPNATIQLFEGINHITFVDDLETSTTLVYENDISPSDREALLDGTATVQTKLEVHNENMFNNSKIELGINWYAYANTKRARFYIEYTPNTPYEITFELPENVNGLAVVESSSLTDTNGNKFSQDIESLTSFSHTFNSQAKYLILQFKSTVDFTRELANNIKVKLDGYEVLTEENSVIDWNHEDFRQVKEEGFIGQFVARQLTGTLHNLTDDFCMTDKEVICKLGVRTNNNTNWYSLGNFLVTKVTDDEVGDKTSFEALDYTKKFNKAFVDRLNYPVTALELAQDVCDQCGVALGSITFKNSNYVIEGNVFTNNESCRDVMKAIGKLAFSWVRVDWDNKVYIDFNPKPFTTNTLPENYDIISNNKYYNLKTQKEVYGPVDKVVIGYSAIEGEKTYIGEENGTCVINVLDNPLVFNQEQRAAIIESASDLLGLTYTPLNTQTVGHPWLRADEPVEVNDMENVSHTTIPLDRTIQYFGHIKTLINSTTETKTNDNLSYKPEMVKNYERSEIYNDQINKQIGIIINEQTDTSNRLNETISTLDGTIQRVSNTETSINDITTTTQVSTGKNHLYLEDAMEGNALSYSVDGATEQQTYSGKNKFNKNNYNEIGSYYVDGTGKIVLGAYNYLTWMQLQANTTYTLSQPKTSNVTIRVGLFSEQPASGVTGTVLGTFTGGTGITQTFTTTSTNVYLAWVYCNTNNLNGYTKQEMLDCIQIEEGSATEYEPYVGGTPSPNPDYPQEVKTIPSIIDLLDYTKFLQGTWNNSTSTTRIVIDGGEFEQGDTITFSNFGGYRYQFIITNQAPQTSGVTSSYNTSYSTNSTYTLTLPSSGHLCIQITNIDGSTAISPSDIVATDFQLEESSVAHEYVPYGYWSKVKVTGKQLYNKEKYPMEQGSFNYNTNANQTSTNRIRSPYMPIQPSTTYTISCNENIGEFAIIYKQKDNSTIIAGTSANTTDKYYTFTTPNNAYYMRFRIGSSTYIKTSTNDYQIQLEQGNQVTPFEPYKENQVLIDMSKENLNKNPSTLNGSFDTSGNITTNNNVSSIYIPCKPNTTYSISKKTVTTRFRAGTTYVTPASGVAIKTAVKNDSGTQLLVKSDNDSQYLIVYYWTSSDTLTEQEILDSITIFEGNNPTPYHELCKIGDYKDILSIDSSGNVVVNKNVGKIVLNGSESGWKVRQGSDTNLYVFYMQNNLLQNSIKESGGYSNYFIENTTPGLIQYDGGFRITGSTVNYLYLCVNNSIATTTTNFKTWLSTHNTNVYYVLATPETITLPNTKIPLFEGINHITFVDDLETSTSITYYRNTPLSGTYATVTQLNDVSTEKTQEIIQVRNEVQTEITSTQASINVINETIENGVSKVNGTGYTFDSEGLKIEKTNQDVKSLLDNDGLAVSYKGTDLLTVRSNGIEAENMTVRKFYVQRPIRMEKTKSISDGSSIGLGFFYVGEED